MGRKIALIVSRISGCVCALCFSDAILPNCLLATIVRSLLVSFLLIPAVTLPAVLAIEELKLFELALVRGMELSCGKEERNRSATDREDERGTNSEECIKCVLPCPPVLFVRKRVIVLPGHTYVARIIQLWHGKKYCCLIG